MYTNKLGLAGLIVVLGMLIAACAPTTPQTVVHTVEVPKEVPVTVVVTATPVPEKPEEAAPGQPVPCESLAGLELPDVKITAAEFVNPVQASESGDIVTVGVWKSPKSAFGQASVSVPFCRVAATVEDHINFEVWMPLPEKWNGRFNGVGNGALSGGINYPSMAGPLERGYATASTDSGHVSPAPVLGDWMEDRPDLWVDFGYRAIHLMTTNAKKIIAAYYGQGPKYSYFTGCSGGGQQALAEAQEYPADYDGIVVGAPACYQTRGWPQEIYPSYLTHRSPAHDIADKLELIKKAALAACDAKDGVEDGVIENPMACDFDPASLLCKGEDAPDCLTAEEVDTVQKIYQGLPNPITGELWYPGFERGSELGWPGHIGEPFVIPVSYFKWVLFDDPNWDWRTFDFEDPEDFAILVDGDYRYGPIINAVEPDLTAFKELGGKLLLWHGWNDQNIAPRNSINYYNSVVKAMGGLEETQEFFRLFMLPGVTHCGGGDGPDTVDWLAVIQAWVEEGVAPDQVIAAKYDKLRINVLRTRPICPYPQFAVYKGTGDTNDAANFACTAP